MKIRHMTIFVIALLLTTVLSVMATRTDEKAVVFVPAASPSTLPVKSPLVAVDAPLPAEYQIISQKNVFQHGPQVSSTKGPESSLVLKGVADTGWFTAFIEDLNTKNILQIRLGEAVGRGKLKNVSLDSVDYECAGLCKHIEIGQNLNGEVIAPATQPVPPPQGPPVPPGDGPNMENAGPPPGPPQPNPRHRKG